MQIRKIIRKYRARFHRLISALGLTGAEASFILFLSAAAFTGAWIPALGEYLKPSAEETRQADSSAADLFGRIANRGLTDSAMIDSLLAFTGHVPAGKSIWQSRSDSLRKMFKDGHLTGTIDSFLVSVPDEPVRKVNINSANVQTLTSLPGIGPKMAERIVEYRSLNGPFRSAEDLMKVRGIGKKTFAKLKPYIDI